MRESRIANNSIDTAAESGVANHNAPRSPLFDQAVAITRAYADRLHKQDALLAVARRVVRVMDCCCNADDRSAGHLCLRCEAREAIAQATDGGR